MSKHVTETTFEPEVLEAPEPVLVDFWAEWCTRATPSHLFSSGSPRSTTLKLVKVNYDEEQRLAERYGVLSIPNMILFENGDPVAQAIGAMPQRALEQVLGLAA